MSGQALLRIVEPAAVEGEKIVEREPRRQRCAPAARDGHEKGQGPHEMRRDALPDAPFLQQLPHQSEFEVPQITQAAMNELRIVGAGRVREIVLFGQRDGKSPERSVAGDAGARGAAPDDMDVEFFVERRSRSRCMCPERGARGGSLTANARESKRLSPLSFCANLLYGRGEQLAGEGRWRRIIVRRRLTRHS